MQIKCINPRSSKWLPAKKQKLYVHINNKLVMSKNKGLSICSEIDWFSELDLYSFCSVPSCAECIHLAYFSSLFLHPIHSKFTIWLCLKHPLSFS